MTHHRSILGFLCVLAVGTLGSAALGQCFGSFSNITPTNIPQFAQFGTDVAIGGDIAVVSADSEAGIGAVYIYRFVDGSWALEDRIVVPMPTEFENFGASVDTDGVRVIVGSPQGDNLKGRAVIFVESAPGSGDWVLEADISHPDTVEFGSFGGAVAINGDMAVIADRSLRVLGQPGAGGAFVYTRSGSDWVFRSRLTASPPQPNGEFGDSVAMDEDRVVVGGGFSGNAPGGMPANGLVNVYRRNPMGVTFEQSLLPPDLVNDLNIGTSLDIDDNRIITGCGSGGTREDVFVYRFDTGTGWSHEFTISQLQPSVYTEFGGSVAIEGDFALVAESEFSQGLNFIGAVRLYQRSGTVWNLVDSFFDPQPEAFDEFGVSVALDQGRVLIGSEDDNTFSTAGGGAFSFISGTLAIQNGPESATVPLGAPASFSVNVTGAEPLTFEWLINGSPLLADAPPYSGTATGTLSISNAFASLPDGVRVRITDACGAVIESAPASLTTTASTCSGDADGDFEVDFSDIAFVLVNFGSMCR